jgi:hypothetical protein
VAQGLQLRLLTGVLLLNAGAVCFFFSSGGLILVRHSFSTDFAEGLCGPYSQTNFFNRFDVTCKPTDGSFTVLQTYLGFAIVLLVELAILLFGLYLLMSHFRILRSISEPAAIEK